MEENLELQKQLDVYLDDLNASQKHMTELMEKQQSNLASPNPSSILEFNEREAEALDTFQNLVERRAALLSQAQSCGYTVQNLEDLSQLLNSNESRARLFQRLKVQGELLVQSSISQWVACQKATLHCRQLIQIVASGGRQSLQSASGVRRSQGGAILDASV